MPKSEFESENYFDGYNESIKELKDKPEVQEIDKLFYQVFETPTGKLLAKEIEERFLMPALANRNSANYGQDVIFCEGFKEAFRFIKTCIASHRQRIATENNKDD